MVGSHQTYPPQDNIVIFDWKFYKSTRIKGTERNLKNGPPKVKIDYMIKVMFQLSRENMGYQYNEPFINRSN